MGSDSTENNSGAMSFGDLGSDDSAFEAFFKAHYPRLCVYCKFKFGFDIAVAEDVVNTSFGKLWEARQTLVTGISPASYLYKIINNTSLNILKHEKIKRHHVQEQLKLISESTEQNSFDSVDLKQLRSDIDAAIAGMPEQMRRTFELSRFEGLKYCEIADQLNISVKTVETQMSRALARLREKLSGYITLILIGLFLCLYIKR